MHELKILVLPQGETGGVWPPASCDLLSKAACLTATGGGT